MRERTSPKTQFRPSQSATMAAEQEFTYAQVAEHREKDDVFIVVHDQVYNASSFVDEHP